MLSVSIDENTVIPYVSNVLQNVQLAIDLASRCGFPGAESLFEKQFEQLTLQGNYRMAADVAARSTQGSLRTIATIQRYQRLPIQPGATPPLLVYFGGLLERGKLNKIETIELSRLVMSQGRLELLNKWMEEDKLECCEELGDLVRQQDLKMAGQIYYRGNVGHKLVTMFIETGQFDKIFQYCQKSSYSPDWTQILVSVVRTEPSQATHFAKKLVLNPSGALIQIEAVVDIFMSQNMLRDTTSFLLDVLKENKPQDAALQTKLLELNLMAAPQVAEAILSTSPPMFTHYDRPRIAELSEQVGLYRIALSHLTGFADIKRVLEKYVNQVLSLFFCFSL